MIQRFSLITAGIMAIPVFAIGGTSSTPAAAAALQSYAQTGWAGYAWHTSSKTVTASLRLPSVVPARNAGASFWDGFGIGPGIEQTGFTANDVNKIVSWTCWYQLYPSPAVAFKKVPRSGDKVTMTVTYRGHSTYTMTLKDTTRHWTVSVTKATKVSDLGIAEATTEAYGPPPAKFSGAEFYNLPTSSGWRYTLPWAKLSALSKHSFTVSWSK